MDTWPNNRDNIDQFFEQLQKAASNHHERKEQLKLEVENVSSNVKFKSYVEVSPCPPAAMVCENEEERNKLYCEILYTIKHKIGKTISGYHVNDTDDLMEYAREAFPGVTTEEHEKLHTAVCEKKPPVLVLTVQVLEASDLVAKDANGLSDPYCMLGIIPGESVFKNTIFSESDELFSSPSISERRKDISRNGSRIDLKEKSSFIKRFNSFRRSDKTSKSSNNLITKSKQSGSAQQQKGQIPAKYIQATSVKRATLNPVWNEQFRCQIDDINKDTLHMDIWDHDDEGNVLEAVKKLNEIKGLRGLDRYFKQIAQSARTGVPEDGANDDFLGSVNIKINDLPSNGSCRWYKLEYNADVKSKVEGKIKLRLSIATTDSFGSPESSDDLEQHEQLIRIFAQYELQRLVAKKTSEWNGHLGREAETILHQHAIQGGLTDYQVALCRWIAFVQMHLEKEFSYHLLSDKLDDVDRVWKAENQSTRDTDMLRASFGLVTDHCFRMIHQMRKVFPVTQNQFGLEKLDAMLKLLFCIYNMPAYKYCNPFSNTLSHELTQLLKTSVTDWLESTRDQLFQLNDEANLACLVNFTTTVYLDMYMAFKFYSPLFDNITTVNYFQVFFKRVDSVLHELITKILREEFGDEIHAVARKINKSLETHQNEDKSAGLVSEFQNLNLTPPKKTRISSSEMDSLNVPSSKSSSDKDSRSFKYNLISEQTAVQLFDVYFTLMAISKFKTRLPENEVKTLHLNSYYELFYLAYGQWVNLIRQKIDIRIKNSFNGEKTNLKLDTSIAVCSVFNHIAFFWRLVQWPEPSSGHLFLKELIELAIHTAITYAHLIRCEAATHFNFNHSNTSYRLVHAANQLQRVRESTKQFVTEIFDYNYSSTKTKEEIFLATEAVLATPNTQLIQITAFTLELVVDRKLCADLSEQFFYLFESPEFSPANESVARLLSYLNYGLAEFKSVAYKSNFDKICKMVWNRLLEQFEVNVTADKSRSKLFFAKMYESLDLLASFLANQSDGRTAEYFTNLEKYISLKNKLKLQTCDTTHLIQLFYQKMAGNQKTLTCAKYGKLYCMAYYSCKRDTLVVNVKRCKNLVPMDQNGLSDPYVVIELQPSYLFHNVDKKTTAIVKGNLSPVFNETFEFKIPKALCLAAGNSIHFTIMDHDLIMRNDFEGEACMELNQLPGIKNELPEDPKNLNPVELYLTNPKNDHCQIIETLEYRETDKLAVDFLRMRPKTE